MTEMTAEVVSIGDEMTSGARLDTNCQWLSRRLGELGIDVRFHSTVGDSLADNVEVFRTATRRVDFVISTGGLGPTRDDLTRDALAELSGKPLEFREESYRHIEALFAKRKRSIPERNRLQAMFPAGSQEIFNPQGTAPGVDLTVHANGEKRSRIFALPGVPAEMRRMFDEVVEPRILEQSAAGQHIQHEVMKFFGVGESEMEQRLGDLIERGRQPRLGITVSSATISLRITATGGSESECTQLINAARQEILDRVGDLHFGDGENVEQQHAVDWELRRRGESLAIVELGFAAPLGDWFAALGDTPSYRGGLSLVGRGNLRQLAGSLGASASPVTSNTDSWPRQQFGADWLLVVDKYPHVDKAADMSRPSAEVRFDIFDPEANCHSQTITLGGHPSILQARIGKAALHWLRTVLGGRELHVST